MRKRGLKSEPTRRGVTYLGGRVRDRKGRLRTRENRRRRHWSERTPSRLRGNIGTVRKAHKKQKRVGKEGDSKRGGVGEI